MSDDSKETVELLLKICLEDSRWLYLIILAGEKDPGPEADEQSRFHYEWSKRMRKALWDASKNASIVMVKP